MNHGERRYFSFQLRLDCRLNLLIHDIHPGFVPIPFGEYFLARDGDSYAVRLFFRGSMRLESGNQRT